MKKVRLHLLVLCASVIFSGNLLAEIHEVIVGDNFFSPNDLTIKVGDTVRWINAAGGTPHSVTADDASFTSSTSNEFTYERTFDSADEILYYCGVHSAPGLDINQNMNGRIVVSETERTFFINAGLNGNWWNGPDRSGEGVQVEISDGGGASRAEDSLILVTTVYSYDTMGNQIFMITVGPVTGDTAEVDVFITTGGLWGDDFDPSLVVESQWGTGTFSASSCVLMHMVLNPNSEYEAKGYTDLEYDLIRLTAPAAPCPL